MLRLPNPPCCSICLLGSTWIDFSLLLEHRDGGTKEKRTRTSLTVSLFVCTHTNIHRQRAGHSTLCFNAFFFTFFHSLLVSCAEKVPFSSLRSHLTSPLSFFFTLRSVSGEENVNGRGKDNKVLGVWRE